MPGKNSKKMIGACVVTAALLCVPSVLKAEGMLSHYTCVADAIQKDNRPEPAKRLFRSQAVENEIIRVQKLLRNSKLAWMFTNCFPNTLDTTVHFRMGKDGKPDTFVYTGDIHAMWLRDSGAQVWPYVQLANSDPELKKMLAGVINRQFKCINIDPYANAFNDGPKGGEWMSDLTDMKPELHERNGKSTHSAIPCVWLISTGRQQVMPVSSMKNGYRRLPMYCVLLKNNSVKTV